MTASSAVLRFFQHVKRRFLLYTLLLLPVVLIVNPRLTSDVPVVGEVCKSIHLFFAKLGDAPVISTVTGFCEPWFGLWTTVLYIALIACPVLWLISLFVTRPRKKKTMPSIQFSFSLSFFKKAMSLFYLAKLRKTCEQVFLSPTETYIRVQRMQPSDNLKKRDALYSWTNNNNVVFHEMVDGDKMTATAYKKGDSVFLIIKGEDEEAELFPNVPVCITTTSDTGRELKILTVTLIGDVHS